MAERVHRERKATGGVRIHYEIPVALHRRAKAEAALRGLTLKDFVIGVLEQAVSKGSKKAGAWNEYRRTT